MFNEYKLLNIKGYHLLLIPFSNNTITVRSNINTGYIHENKDNLGINHLLEHVLVNGNKQCNNKDCISHMNKNGILMNASTSFKNIEYYNSGLTLDTYDMIKYIIYTTLSTNNINNNIINKEKKAIINELLTASNSGMIEVHKLFANKFFNYYGEQNFFNYKLQINNLDKLNENILIKYFNEHYNQILFTITGDFNEFEIVNQFNLLLPNKNQIEPINSFNKCFSFNNSINYIKNNDLSNTLFYIVFPSNLSTDIVTLTYIKIAISYINDYTMSILRAKEHLIYSLNVQSEYSYCGHITNIEVNVENKNAIKVYNKLMNILIDIKNGKNEINKDNVNGIVKKLKYSYLNNSKDIIENFYKEQIQNNIFNNKNYKILNYSEYLNILDNISITKIKEVINQLFNFNHRLVIYTSKEKLNI